MHWIESVHTKRSTVLLLFVASTWYRSTGTFDTFTSLLYIWLDRENTHSLVRYQETLQLVTSQMSVNTCSSQLKWQWHDSCLQFQVIYFKIHLGFLVLSAQMTVWQRRSAQCNRSVPYKIHQKLSACVQCGALIRMFALFRL